MIGRIMFYGKVVQQEYIRLEVQISISLLTTILLKTFSIRTFGNYSFLKILPTIENLLWRGIEFLQIGVTSTKNKMWKSVWCAWVWALWCHRNNIIFKQQIIDLDSVVGNIKYKSWIWLKANVKEFHFSFIEGYSNPATCLQCLRLWMYIMNLLTFFGRAVSCFWKLKTY